MRRVGLIINPAAGRDVRRLVAEAELVGVFTKINVAKRFILGLSSIGVDEILLMPDNYGIAEALIRDLSNKVEINLVDIEPRSDVSDTILAASLMSKEKVDIIVGFGGDGTLRAIFKGAGSTPIAGVPLGTNNVLSRMAVDPTVLGVLIGLSINNVIPLSKSLIRMKSLKLFLDGTLTDMALIDIAFLNEKFTGARAVWDISSLSYVIYSKCEPTDIGLASIGGNIYPVSINDDHGLMIKLGREEASKIVKAVIAPGLVKTVYVKSFKIIKVGDKISIPGNYYNTIAFDGERELTVTPNSKIEVLIDRSGPLLYDPNLTLRIYQSMLYHNENFKTQSINHLRGV